MNKPFKFALPPPNFNKINKDACKPKPHFLTPSGMSLLPREKQPPPMYGKHGSTVPSKYLLQQPNGQNQQTVKTIVEKQYCESCELEFHSIDDLKRHRSQHETCPVAGCSYKGHPSVMDKHINALHASGLFEKFKKLSTPEEISAWREERRKRYPTVANVLLKQKAHAQRQKRGERLEANKSRFGKVNDRKRAQPNTMQNQNLNEAKRPKDNKAVDIKNNKRNRKNKRKQNPRNQDKLPEVHIEAEKNINENQIQEDDHPIRCGIKMFTGTSQLKDYKHFNVKKAPTNKVLFSLVGMYGSDDEDESEEDNYNDNMSKQSELKEGNLEKEDESVDNIRCLETYTNKSHNFYEIQVENIKNLIEETQLTTDSKKVMSVTKTEGIDHDNLSLNKNNISKIQEIESKFTNQLANVTASVSNDNNSSDEGPDEAPIQRNSTEVPLSSKATLSQVPKIESSIKRNKIEERKTTLPHRHLAKRRYGLDYRKARLRKQNTMLEKLLEVDVRHERNILLQCVRYVCENNFFGIGQNDQVNPR